MKRILNTLYVTQQKTYLARKRETVQIREDGKNRLQVPIHTISSIVCFGNVTVSPFLLGLCGERDVTVSFMTEHGRFLARVEGETTGNVLLRRAQFHAADDEGRRASIARNLICGKLANARTSLKRHVRDNRDHPSQENVERVISQLGSILGKLAEPGPLENTRGFEGEAARLYFSVFDHLVVQQKEHFAFKKRSRRPPLDNLNALLSFLYTLLAHDARSACESVGLDPAVGFLHMVRPGRPSLALDLMEELRPVLADRIALALVNRKQISGRGFLKSPTGGVEMNEETRKQVLVTYQKRKRDGVIHPFLGKKVPV